jgi:hypothetical protein
MPPLPAGLLQLAGCPWYAIFVEVPTISRRRSGKSTISVWYDGSLTRDGSVRTRRNRRRGKARDFRVIRVIGRAKSLPENGLRQ